MSYVFDASSILSLTRELGERVIDVVKGNLTADLALYEIGNALWKECSLFQRLSVEGSVKTLKLISGLLGLMKVVDVRSSHLSIEVLVNALNLKITYYDAAYFTLAKKAEAILITNDERLAEISKKNGVETLGSMEFIKNFFE